MTKVFVFGAPGSGILRVAEELYMRDDFKKLFSQDPIYKRVNFGKTVLWDDISPIIASNYQADQSEQYEVHSGWWISRYFRQIVETYPDSIFVCVSRYSRDSLKKIALSGNPTDMIDRQGGPEEFQAKVEAVDISIENIAAKLNARWTAIAPDETIFAEDFSIIPVTDDPKPASIKIAVGKLK